MVDKQALSLEGISKRFGGVQALNAASLHAMPGEVVACVGENGAGKSTLVGVAAGRLAPDEGVIRVGGRSFESLTPAAAADAGVRLVPQELLLCSDMSVVDNIVMGKQRPIRRGALLDRPAARVEAQRRLERLRVPEIDLDAPAGSLSVVDQTFVQIARGFTPGASVMLIDEPTAPMDGTQVETFLDVLQAVTEQGIAIVYVSHRLDEVFQLADRVTVLRDGRTVANLSGSEMTHTNVIDAMVGGVELRDFTLAQVSDEQAVLEVSGLDSGVIQDVSFMLRQGEVLTVYGISGSGRERLGGALVGAHDRKGEVRVQGSLLRANDIPAAVRAGIGYVPPERRTQGLALEASVSANLTIAVLRQVANRGIVTGRSLERVAERWIDSLDIKTASASAPIGTLSGGSQQKVLLARWLAAGSRVLVLEEPTRGVDVGTKAEIYHLLSELTGDGTASLIITSDIEEAAVASRRVLVMRDGRIVADLDRPDQRELAHVAQADEVRT